MKNLIAGTLLLSLLSLLSCTKVVYTNEQVISLYKTKNDVLKRFNVPTEKKTNDSTEEWLYRYDRNNSFADHSLVEYPNLSTVNVKEFSRYKRYIIFMMDKRGDVIRCDYNGVDLTVRKKNTAGTFALVFVGLVLVGANYVSSQSFSFNP